MSKLWHRSGCSTFSSVLSSSPLLILPARMRRTPSPTLPLPRGPRSLPRSGGHLCSSRQGWVAGAMQGGIGACTCTWERASQAWQRPIVPCRLCAALNHCALCAVQLYALLDTHLGTVACKVCPTHVPAPLSLPALRMCLPPCLSLPYTHAVQMLQQASVGAAAGNRTPPAWRAWGAWGVCGACGACGVCGVWVACGVWGVCGEGGRGGHAGLPSSPASPAPPASPASPAPPASQGA